jgi:hypothetical protein
MNEVGKALLGLGLLLAFIGAVLMVAGRIALPLGRLPGDFVYKGKDVSVFFPLGTSIPISIILSATFYLFSRFRRKSDTHSSDLSFCLRWSAVLGGLAIPGMIVN